MANSARHGHRSSRTTWATILLIIAAVSVAAAAATWYTPIVVGAAALAVVLGLAATVIIRTELNQTRYHHTAERAKLATEYSMLTTERIRQDAGFREVLTGRSAYLQMQLREAEAAHAQALMAADEATSRAEIAESELGRIRAQVPAQVRKAS